MENKNTTFDEKAEADQILKISEWQLLNVPLNNKEMKKIRKVMNSCLKTISEVE